MTTGALQVWVGVFAPIPRAVALEADHGVIDSELEPPAARDREEALEHSVGVGGAVIAAEGAPDEVIGRQAGEVTLDLRGRQDLRGHPERALEGDALA
jgi:hypothetical protein